MKRWKPLYIFGALLLSVVLFVSSILLFWGFSSDWRKENQKTLWERLLEDFDWENFPWDKFPFDMLENFPWDTLPWDSLPDNFNWNNLPWDKLTESFPWEKLPWISPPADFPWEKVPWESLPWDKLPWGDVNEDFPWENIPWGDIEMDALPEDFPWDQVPWEDVPEDFPWDEVPWEDVPVGDLPENFPWENVPWEDMPEDFPWEEVPWENMEPETWETFPWESLPPDFPWWALPWLAISPSVVPEGVFPEDFYPAEWQHEHKYESEVWHVTRAATCGVPGLEENVCTICKRTIVREIPATNLHNFDEQNTCSVCGIRRLILMSESKKEQYSGEYLVGDAVPTLLAGSAGLLEGHSINMAGIRFARCEKLGKVANVFSFAGNVAIVDEEGNDVSSMYYIQRVYGTLELTKREIVLRTPDKTKKEDGTYLMGDEGKEDDYTVEGLVAGDRLVDVVFGEGLLEAGRKVNEIISYRIVNAAGEDVTGNYSVEVQFGLLRVTH